MIKTFLSRLRAAGSVSAIAAAAAGAGDAIECAPLVAAATAEGAPLQRVRVLPVGTFTLRDGRGPFTVADMAHAQAIVDASLAYAGNRDIPFDYDHQLLHAIGPAKGGVAAASGWIKQLSAEADGVYAQVEWTPAAAQKLADREYRYISPTFAFDKASGRVRSIRYGSLVNDNAIDELLAVASTAAAEAATQRENIVDYTKIAAALGLPATATEADILAALGAAAMPAVMAACATSLGLAEAAKLDDVIAAATAAGAAKPDPAKFVPVEALTAANTRLAALEVDRHDQVIAAATAEGKLTPAMTDWAKGYIAKDEAGFQSWLATAPVVVAAGTLPRRAMPADAAKADELVAAASTYIAEQATKGVIVDAATAVRHIQSVNAGA